MGNQIADLDLTTIPEMPTYAGSEFFIKDMVDERDKNFFSLTDENRMSTSAFGPEENNKANPILKQDEEDFL